MRKKGGEQGEEERGKGRGKERKSTHLGIWGRCLPSQRTGLSGT